MTASCRAWRTEKLCAVDRKRVVPALQSQAGLLVQGGQRRIDCRADGLLGQRRLRRCEAFLQGRCRFWPRSALLRAREVQLIVEQLVHAQRVAAVTELSVQVDGVRVGWRLLVHLIEPAHVGCQMGPAGCDAAAC